MIFPIFLIFLQFIFYNSQCKILLKFLNNAFYPTKFFFAKFLFNNVFKRENNSPSFQKFIYVQKYLICNRRRSPCNLRRLLRQALFMGLFLFAIFRFSLPCGLLAVFAFRTPFASPMHAMKCRIFRKGMGENDEIRKK